MLTKDTNKIKIPVLTVLLMLGLNTIDALEIKITSVRCTTLDYTFTNISKCETKAISQSVSETSIRQQMLEPLTNAIIKLRLMKRSTTSFKYYPYYHKFDFDLCKFMAVQYAFPVVEYLYGFVKDFSNVNHSCPYEDELIIERFRINYEKISKVPIPVPLNSDYAFYTTMYSSQKARSDIKIYFSIKE